jgi:hypothetical protein
MGKGIGIEDLEETEDLTLQEAKQFDCCKHLSDDEILELLDVLKVFTQVAYSVFAKQRSGKNKEDDFKQAA